MPCRLPILLLAVAAACGGGGATTTSVVATTASLGADDVEIGTAAASADLLVRLVSVPAEAPCLLEVGVELPAALALPATGRLQAATALPNLDGDFVGDRFVVMCGDAQNAAAGPLAVGPLFRLRLLPSTPRQAGTYTVRLHNLRAATRHGDAVPVAATPAVIQVVVR